MRIERKRVGSINPSPPLPNTGFLTPLLLFVLSIRSRKAYDHEGNIEEEDNGYVVFKKKYPRGSVGKRVVGGGEG
jgi:hypothetical protein